MIAAETQGIAVICGMVTAADADSGKKVMNSAALLRDGRIEFTQSKMLLPTYDVFDEARNFAPAKSQHLIDFSGMLFALTICEDAWNDKRFWTATVWLRSRRGTGAGRRQLRAQHLGVAVLAGQARAAARHAGGHRAQSKGPVAMVNQVGGNDSLVFDGSSR